MFIARNAKISTGVFAWADIEKCLPCGEEGADILGGAMKRTKILIHTIAFAVIVMTGILLAMITTSAETHTGIAGNSITWTLDTETGVMEFSGEGRMNSFNFRWNEYRSSVKTVIISDGITSIGDNAFALCTNLTEVRVPRDLQAIGEEAFYGCTSLTYFQFPEKLTSIEDQAFFNSGLEKVVLPDSVVSLGAGAFASCKQLRSVELPDTLTEIRDSCFSGCESLVYIHLPKQLKVIRSHGLANCSSMTELVLPEGVETLEDAALAVTPIQRLVIPESLTYMGENALNYVEEIEILDLAAFCRAYSSSTTFRFTQGFYHKGALITTLTVPASVKDFQAMGFSAYPCLRWIEVERGNPVYTASGNCLIHIKNQEVVLGYANSSIPGNGSVTKIGRFAFAYNLELLTLSIPEGVKIIGENAFRCCWNLIYLYLPDTVTDIQVSAFRGCENLTGIRVPKSLTNCASDAFSGCISLYVVWNRSKFDIRIGGASVGLVGLNARILFDENNRVIQSSEASYSDGFVYDLNGLLAYVGSQTTVTLPVDTVSKGYGSKLRGFVHVIIPSGATEIPDSMFEGCTTLRSVQISKTVKTIGHGAFAYCPNLETITVDPDNSTYYASGNCLIEKVKRDVNLSGDKWESMKFGRILFGNCHSTIPTDPFVREIADLAFCDENMTSIFIPDNIWVLGYECFGRDDRLMLKEIHMDSIATWAHMISNEDYHSGIHLHL